MKSNDSYKVLSIESYFNILFYLNSWRFYGSWDQLQCSELFCCSDLFWNAVKFIYMWRLHNPWSGKISYLWSNEALDTQPAQSYNSIFCVRLLLCNCIYFPNISANRHTEIMCCGNKIYNPILECVCEVNLWYYLGNTNLYSVVVINEYPYCTNYYLNAIMYDTNNW